MMASKKKITKESEADRENYICNRDNMLADFNACLAEVQKDKPSVGGTIVGMDFQQFSAKQIFFLIIEQENYIKYSEKYKPAYVNIEEEKRIFNSMIKGAKAIFKKDYTKWYKSAAAEE